MTAASLNAPPASPWLAGLSKFVLHDPHYLDLQMQGARVSVTLNPWYQQSYELGGVPHTPTQEVKVYLGV